MFHIKIDMKSPCLKWLRLRFKKPLSVLENAFLKRDQNLLQPPVLVREESRSDYKRDSTPYVYFHLKCARWPLGNLSVGTVVLFFSDPHRDNILPNSVC